MYVCINQAHRPSRASGLVGDSWLKWIARALLGLAHLFLFRFEKTRSGAWPLPDYVSVQERTGLVATFFFLFFFLPFSTLRFCSYCVLGYQEVRMDGLKRGCPGRLEGF